MIAKINRLIRRKLKIWKQSRNPELVLGEIPIKGNSVKVNAPFTVNNTAAIQLGSNVKVMANCNLQSDGGICIQDNVTIEQNVKLVSHSKTKKYEPIIIGSTSIIGRNSTILPGVKIPSGSRVAPNSIIESWPSELQKNHSVSVGESALYSNQTLPGTLVFVVSTGRSGSKAIASLFQQHSQVHAIHDSFQQFGRYAIDKLYKRIKPAEIKSNLSDTFDGLSYITQANHVQSDQKLGALITELAEIFPSAKFIWLIRNLEDFVNSAYARGWFDNSEFGYPVNQMEFASAEHKPARYYASYRINGARTGAFTEEVWKEMTAFERNCWYWRYWNTLIESQLTELSPERHMKLYLRDLQNKSEELQQFASLPVEDLIAKKVNKAFYKKIDPMSWTPEMRTIFAKYDINFSA